MGRFVWRHCLPTLAALGLLSAGALAEGPAARESDTADAVARLEAQLKAQQQRIAELEQQVASARAQDVEQQRVEAMREQIREILSEKEFRESLMPTTLTAGYDNGFYIRSTDDAFLLRVNGRMQFRFTHYGTRKDNRYLLPRFQRDDRTGFDVQRMRLTFSGHAWNEDLTYHFQIRMDAPQSNDAQLHYGWVNYRFQDEFQVKFGVFRLASTRAQFTSDANLSLIDRPVADSVFGLGIGMGVRFWGSCADNRVDWYLDVVNSLNSPGGRTITPDPAEHDNNPAIVFRVVWHILGDREDFLHQADLEFHESPVWDLGFHYAFNEDERDRFTTRQPFPRRRLGFFPGGFGLTTTNGTQIHQFGIDTHIKYNGFSAIAEYWFRTVDVRRATRRPFTPIFLLTGDGSTNTQHGAYLQVGYFLPIPGYEKKIEAVARVGGISTLFGEVEGTWTYSAGLNYYIQGDKVKLQTDVTKVTEVPITDNYTSLANVNDDALIWRVQLQVGF